MSSKTTFKLSKRVLSVLLAMLLLAFTAVAALPSASAVETSEGVKKCMDSVLQIRMKYQPDKSDDIIVSSGSCFVVNPSTVLTCAHIFEGNDIIEYAKKTYGRNHVFDREKNGKKIDVLVNGGAPVPATIKKIMVDQDYAILKLDEPIKRPSVTFGASSESEITDHISTLGFPTLTGALQDSKTYSNDQMSVSTSTITSKTTTDGIKYFMHDAIIANGASGGPLVNDQGLVIGINLYQDKSNDSASNYFRAIETDQILAVFKDLGYEYTQNTGGGDEPATEATEATGEKEETTIAPTTEKPEPATTKKTNEDGFNEGRIDVTKLIIIIAIAVVIIVIIVVILIIVLGGKKKNKGGNGPSGPAGPGGGYPAAPPRPQPPVPPYTPAPPAPTAPNNDGAGETSVLNDGAGETSVIVSPGFNPETVDYCISDNNSVSRTHAKIRVRAGRCYISDLGSTNCTYVNGTKLTPNQEVILSAGDKIKISDEEFEFIG